jgi:transcriptional regulator
MIKRIEEKHYKVLQERDTGKTLAQIGKEMGLTRARVQQLEFNAREYLEALEKGILTPFDTLSTRTQHCLLQKKNKDSMKNMMYTKSEKPTIKDISMWVNSGELLKTPGIGKKTLYELQTFLSKYKDQIT